MKHYLSAGLVVLALLLNAADGELLDNPKFENNAAGWNNWGRKQGLKLTSTPEGLLITAAGQGLNQGPAQTLKLKPGHEYEYSCRLKGKLAENASAQLLHWHFPQIKKGGNLRKLRDNFEWWDHKVRFSVPKDCNGVTVLRPVLLHGPGEIIIERVSLKELGESVSRRPAQENKIPEIVPVKHPKKKIDLSDLQPVNVRAHIREKVSAPPEGCSVRNRNGEFVIRYKFTTSGHDALMFDLVKRIDSCKKISMEITSDGKGHRLFFVLTDKSGEAHLTGKPIILNFKGRRKFNMVIPLPREEPYSILDSIWGGDGNQHLDLPLKSLTVVLDDSPDASMDSGVIAIKNLKIGNW